MADDMTGLVLLGAAAAFGLLVGYLIGRSSATRSVRSPTVEPERHYAPMPGSSYERPMPRTASQQPRAESALSSQARSRSPQAAAAAAPQILPLDTRPDDDRTLIRKLRSASAAFKESKEHLEAAKEVLPEDDSVLLRVKKPEK